MPKGSFDSVRSLLSPEVDRLTISAPSLPFSVSPFHADATIAVPASPGGESSAQSTFSLLNRRRLTSPRVLTQLAPEVQFDAALLSPHISIVFDLFNFNPELRQADSELRQSCGFPDVCDEAGTGAGHAGMAAVGRGKTFHWSVVLWTCLGDGGVGSRVKGSGLIPMAPTAVWGLNMMLFWYVDIFFCL